VTFISSDPHHWLRPIYAKLRADAKFCLLAPAHQWDALVNAAAEESPTKAEQMRECSPAAQVGLLGWLSDTLRQNPEPERAVLLWSMKKGERDLTCVADQGRLRRLHFIPHTWLSTCTRPLGFRAKMWSALGTRCQESQGTVTVLSSSRAGCVVGPLVALRYE
jgi:hypothetical protein